MTRRLAFIAIGIIAALAAVVLIINNLTPRGPKYLAGAETVPAMPGFLEMCRWQASLCATPPTSASVPDDASLKAQIVRVNHEVNARIIQRTDTQIYGVGDLWRPATTIGDCEDIALAKRLALVAAGFPADRLFLAIANVPSDGLHTVLIARLRAGDMVLDNRFDFVEPVARAGYTWIAVQSISDPMEWRTVPPN